MTSPPQAAPDGPAAAPDGPAAAPGRPQTTRDGRPAATPDGHAATPPPPPRLWLDHAREVTGYLARWLSRPRVRLTIIGVLLLLIGGVFVTSSVWTLPLLIAGVLMVAISWVGHRLDGRLAVEWGPAGTRLEFRAQIKAADSAHPALSAASGGPRQIASSTEAELADAEVVEGEAHTVEIEVGELKALIAAAENAEAENAQTDAWAHASRNLRVANGGARSTESGR